MPSFVETFAGQVFAPDRRSVPAGTICRFVRLSSHLGGLTLIPTRRPHRQNSAVFVHPGRSTQAHFDLDRLNADQGMAKPSRAPHMPNIMTKAASPAAVALAIRKRSAKRGATPWASSTDRPPAARCERTKKTARP